MAEEENAIPGGNESDQPDDQGGTPEVQVQEGSEEAGKGGEGKPEDRPGYQVIDFKTADRSEIEARFNRVYGQLKGVQNEYRQLSGDYRQLVDRFENIEKANAATQIASRLETLQGDWQKAMDEGDHTKAFGTMKEIVTLQSQANVPVQAPEPRQEPQQNGVIQSDEQAAVTNWVNSKEYTQDGHKFQRFAAAKLTEIFTDPDWDYKPVEERLAEVDRQVSERISPKKSPPPQMNGGEPPRPPAKGVKLNENQRITAYRMFPELGKVDAEKKYAKHLGSNSGGIL